MAIRKTTSQSCVHSLEYVTLTYQGYVNVNYSQYFIGMKHFGEGEEGGK